MHRVRSVIPYLSFTELRKEKCLPKKGIFTGIKRGGVFPKIIYRIEYYHFGMFLDWYIRKVLCNTHKINMIKDDGKISIKSDIEPYDLFVWCSLFYFPNEDISDITQELFEKDIEYYKKIGKFIRKNFKEAKNIELEPEWSYEKISGHPDIIVDDTIFDIKTSGQFNKMRTETILQLLTYFCIGKKIGKKISKIGVILPAQELVLTFDLSEWNHAAFWPFVEKALETKISLVSSEKETEIYMTKIFSHVGSHVTKNISISKTLEAMPKIPVQIFLAGRKNTTPKIRESDIKKTLKLVEEKGYRLYIHAPYTINVSKRYDDDWNITCIQNFLDIAKSMGSKGVIVHCGIKTKDIEEKIALKNMRRFIRKASKNATEKCKLIIETPAGKKGELLAKRKDFIEFYKSLSPSRIGICVDTCHVYSAGYKPNLYIKKLLENDLEVSVIHYNDSKTLRGSCKDEHAMIGCGYIGLKILNKVGLWAIENDVDMIHE